MKCCKNYSNLRVQQLLLLLFGLLFFVLGIWRQESKTVLIKAIYICMECIGIG